MEIKILQKVLQANDALAEQTRQYFKSKGILVINLMGSPGAGKTTFISRTIEALKGEINFAVIEGDITSTIDAERLSRLGIPVVQINTEPFDGACHLEATWIKDAALSFDLQNLDVIIIENVGNLVCPAEFDTGAHKNVVILSTPEGEDKPLKYPLMFRVSHAVVINKIDLREILDYNLEVINQNLTTVNDALERFILTSKTGEGFSHWIDWVRNQLKIIRD
ncbi:hydrogenase nickel incorporation protein HypB [bacterium]|nr:hydrogenase nickel incorporation protein HypB [bacterium]